LTATADVDDLRAMKALVAKANPPQPAAPLGVASKPAAAKPAALSPPVLTSEYRTPAHAPALAAPVLVPAASLAPAAPRIAAAAAAAPAPKSAPAAPALPAPKPPVMREAVQIRRGVPGLESTQTVRALTQWEVEDEQVQRWFVIQLSLAEDAFDPDTVPNLDIFTVYRLYSVAGIDQGRIMHALRVGFFSEDTAAAAVASYLAAFYDKPTVKRVSAAERRRFAEQPLEPRKDVGSTGKQAVIEITNERYIREKRGGQAAGK
jgi:hypothetical protein